MSHYGVQTRWITNEKEVKVTSSADKCMLYIFWNSCGVIVIEYLERGHNVTAGHFCASLSRLREGVRRKHLEMLSDCINFSA